MMPSILLYSLKSAFTLVLLYVPYVLMLRRESFFRFNRAMLLGIMFLSLILPLCNIPWLSMDSQPVVHAAQKQLLELGIPVSMLPEVDVTGTLQPASTGITFFSMLSILYIIGIACVAVLRVGQLIRLSRGVRKGSLWSQEQNGVRLYCHAGEVKPFSWMRNVVISENDYAESGREIFLHEMGHIRANHSWDVVLLGLVQMVQWWNPLVYMLGISLRDVHEYEADDYVLHQGVEARAYQLLVIKKAVGSGSYASANNFNHSLTKKRITMMCRKSKSKAWMRSKALYVIPVAALALSAFATPKIMQPAEQTLNNLAGKVTEKSENLQVSDGISSPRKVQRLSQDELKALGFESLEQALSSQIAGEPEDTTIHNKPAVNAEYPGGWDACYAFLSENLRYPQICQWFGVQGRTIYHFVVEKDGSISNIEKVRGPSMQLTQENVAAWQKEHPEAANDVQAGVDLGQLLADEGIRVIRLMPKWQPAQNEKGEPVRCFFYLPIIFRLQ